MLDVVGETLDGLVLKSAPKEDTLEASLDAYTKPNLIKLAEVNDFEVKQSWNKGQIIEVISAGLRESLEERLANFEDNQIEALQELLEGNTEQTEKNSEVIASAVNQGLLYVASEDEEYVYSMPAEFEAKLKEATEETESEEEVEEEVTAEPVKASTPSAPFMQRPRRVQPVQQRIVGNKVGRNDPCPCGSGKKYKKCCWSKDQRKAI